MAESWWSKMFSPHHALDPLKAAERFFIEGRNPWDHRTGNAGSTPTPIAAAKPNQPSAEDQWAEVFKRVPGFSEADARDAARAKLLSMDPDPHKQALGAASLQIIGARVQKSQATQQLGYSPESLAQMAKMRAQSDTAAFEQMARLQDSWGADIAKRMPGFARDVVDAAPGAGLGNLTRQLAQQQQTYDMGMPERVLNNAISAQSGGASPYDSLFGLSSGGIPSSLNLTKPPGT